MSVNNIQREKNWRNIILDMGYYYSVFAITLFSVLMSVIITGVIMTIFWWEGVDVLFKALLVAAIIPGIVAPLATKLVVKFLFELEELQNQLLEIIHLDPLTKIYNRRYILDCLESEATKILLSNEPMSLLILDVDNFKSVNDCYGHENGDIVLQEITKVCKFSLRPHDIIARLGGEEFVILLPNTPLSEACDIAEHIRENVANTSIILTSGEKIRKTISIGISYFVPPDPKCTNLLSRADKGLYKAKNNGRNQWAIVE